MDNVDVLIIDDDNGVRWFLGEMLRLKGLSSLGCSTGSEGLALAARCKPKLAIIDYKLGGMNGVEVALSLNRVCRDTGIIFVTGFCSEVLGDFPEDLPVAACLQKPFDVDELMEIIRRVLPNSSK